MLDKEFLITTSVTIDRPLFDFMKTKGFKASNLLRSKLIELRDRESGERSVLVETIKNLNAFRDKAIKFIEQAGLTESFLNF